MFHIILTNMTFTFFATIFSSLKQKILDEGNVIMRVKYGGEGKLVSTRKYIHLLKYLTVVKINEGHTNHDNRSLSLLMLKICHLKSQ